MPFAHPAADACDTDPAPPALPQPVRPQRPEAGPADGAEAIPRSGGPLAGVGGSEPGARPGIGRPSGLNPRQEMFCQMFVIYQNATAAAGGAGYSPLSARTQGYRLMRTHRIRARIRDLQRALGDEYGTERAQMLGKLEMVYRRAIEYHHFHAAARAVEMQARLAGLMRSRPAPVSASGSAPVSAPGSPRHGTDDDKR